MDEDPTIHFGCICIVNLLCAWSSMIFSRLKMLMVMTVHKPAMVDTNAFLMGPDQSLPNQCHLPPNFEGIMHSSSVDAKQYLTSFKVNIGRLKNLQGQKHFFRHILARLLQVLGIWKSESLFEYHSKKEYVSSFLWQILIVFVRNGSFLPYYFPTKFAFCSLMTFH